MSNSRSAPTGGRTARERLDGRTVARLGTGRRYTVRANRRTVVLDPETPLGSRVRYDSYSEFQQMLKGGEYYECDGRDPGVFDLLAEIVGGDGSA